MRCFLIVLFLTTSGVAQEPPKRLRVGASSSVPMAYLSPEGDPVGFYVEVFREAARLEKLELQMVIGRVPPDKAVESGAVDIWAVAVPTAERRQKFHLTKPWWTLSNYLAVMTSSSIGTQYDLSGKTVLYTTTPPHTVPLAEFLPGSKLRIEERLEARFEALCSGKADAILFYESTPFAVLGSPHLSQCRERGIRIFPVDRPVMELSIMSSPANRDLAERIRSRIAVMQREGVLERLPSFRLTSNEQLKAEWERERRGYQESLWKLGVLFAVILIAGGSFAYLRLRAAHARVRASLAAAEEANRAKSRFLATMSHEIRTPMTAVLGYTDMLIATGLRPDQEQFAREVNQATTSLLAMLTDVLDYSRSLSGSIPIQHQPFDPVAVIDDSVAAVLLQAESKSLELVSTIDASLPSELIGDAARLRHMILNLIANAVKFTSKGWVKVSARYEAGPRNLRIVVADSGLGIPADKQQLIFLPFTQVDSTHQRSHGGIGLGLAIVSDFCRQMGGTISVISREGAGAEFVLEVPMDSAVTAPGWLTAVRPAEPTVAIGVWRDRRHTQVLADYLREAGYALRDSASDGDFLAAASAADVARVLCFIDSERCDDNTVAALRTWRQTQTNRQVIFVLIGPVSFLRETGREVRDLFDVQLSFPIAGRAFRELSRPSRKPSLPEKIDADLRVLVVDDNAVNRYLLSSLLDKLGCRADSATNGMEATESAALHTYSLILMDCQMPVMYGFEATRRIRASGSKVPIWGVSAAMESEVRQQCLDWGMDGYIAKPVDLNRLHALLRSLQRTPVG